jgi:hypothetical protein
MRNDIVSLAHNFEPWCGFTMLTRQEWTTGPGQLPIVKKVFWYTDGFKKGTVFQDETDFILVCIYKIQKHTESEIYISIFYDSQVALEVLYATKNKVPNGKSAPVGVEYFHSPFCETHLVPRTFWS